MAVYPEKALTRRVIGAAIEVHNSVGPGLLESVYHRCLTREFDLRDIRYQSEVCVPMEYKGLSIPAAYRIDFVIEGKLVLEVKAIEMLLPIHTAQLITYLRLTRLSVGLLINFNVPKLVDGVKRVIV